MSLNAARDGELTDPRGAPLRDPGADVVHPMPEGKCVRLEVPFPGGVRFYYLPDPTVYENCFAGRNAFGMRMMRVYEQSADGGRVTFHEDLELVNAPVIREVVDQPIWWKHEVDRREKKIKKEEK